LAQLGPNDVRSVALDTRTPYVLHFNGADGGLPLTRRRGRIRPLRHAERGRRVKEKLAYYWPRWVNTKGEPGPWSEPASATVGA
jgi:hypothetical protein